MSKARQTTVSIIDVGSSKVVCFIAKISPSGRVEITGIGHNVSNGIRAGKITDIKAAEVSILQAVESAEKMAGERVKRVFVSISSNCLISQRIRSELNIAGHEVAEKDLNKLLLKVLDKFNEKDLDVIHSFAYDYMIDGNRGIDSPLGMYGNNLLGDFHIISSPVNNIMNITSCFNKCHLEIENFMSSSYVSGLACLTPDEMQLGSTLIEIGGGASSISVFHKGHMVFTDAIPWGGMHITNDIARGISTNTASAERIKVLYGNLKYKKNEDSEYIEIPSSISQLDNEIHNVDRALLTEIIQARVDEILDILVQKLEASGVADLGANKVVLSGGSAQLGGFKDYITDKLSTNVRLGYPQTVSGLAESTSGISFATPVGMLLQVADTETHFSYGNSRKPANDYGPLGSVFQWLKDNFG